MRGKARGKDAAEAYFQYVRVRLIPKQRSPAPKSFAKSGAGGRIFRCPAPEGFVFVGFVVG